MPFERKRLVIDIPSHEKKQLKFETRQSAWYPAFHFAPEFGEIVAVAGVTWFTNTYYIFFEWRYKESYTHLYAVKTTDFNDYTHLGFINTPMEIYEETGVYRGTFESSNRFTYYSTDKDLKPHVRTAHFDGVHLKKSTFPLEIKGVKKSLSRYGDPYVKKVGNIYYMLLSGVDAHGNGEVIVLSSTDGVSYSDPKVLQHGLKNEGEIWTNVNIFTIGQTDVFSITKEIIETGERIHGYTLGRMNFEYAILTHSVFHKWDYGHSFISPYIINDNIPLLLGLLDEDQSSPTDEDHWRGILALPREIYLHNDKLYQYPPETIENLRTEELSAEGYITHFPRKMRDLYGTKYELFIELEENNATELYITLRMSHREETIIQYNKQTQSLSLARAFSGESTADMLLEKVAQKLQNDLKVLRIFVDESTIEVFANYGDVVMASRIYPRETSTGLELHTELGEAHVKVTQYQLKSFDFMD